MKTLLSVILNFLVVGLVFAQQPIHNFDTSNVFVGDSIYDYKNPRFENVYEVINSIQGARISFERHSEISSDIMIRFINYNTFSDEAVIASNGFKNINASFSNNMIVWQSNVNGNWDILYSVFSNGTWSTPSVAVSSSDDVTNPNVHFTGYTGIYFLTYEKNGDIYFTHFRDGQWNFETTNVTSHLPENCSSPMFIAPSYSYSPALIFITGNQISNVVMRSYAYVSSSQNFAVSISTPEEIQSIINPRAIRGSNSIHQGISFNKNGADSSDFYELEFVFNNIVNHTNEYEGYSFNGKATYCQSLIAPNFFSRFISFQNLHNDSLTFKIKAPYSFGPMVLRSSFYIGNSNASTRFDLSNGILSENYSAFRIVAIWEQVLNGKSVLMESSFRDFMNNFEVASSELPTEFKLQNNYPNPFNPETTIKFDVPVSAGNTQVSIKIFDINGRFVTQLTNQNFNPGSYELKWNGAGFASGIYFYTLTAGTFTDTKRAVLIK